MTQDQKKARRMYAVAAIQGMLAADQTQDADSWQLSSNHARLAARAMRIADACIWAEANVGAPKEPQ